MEIILIVLIISFLGVEILNNKRIYDLQKKISKEKVKISNADKKKMEAMKKSFNNLMEYDEDVAMKRK